MPNWCYNSLMIRGPKKIIEEIEKTGLSLESILPCPQELRENTSPIPDDKKKLKKEFVKKYGSEDWWQWCNKNWGTKWDIQPDISVEPVGGSKKEFVLYATFDSAWGPPAAAFKVLYEKYKDKGITLFNEYFECGQKFAGICQGRNGKWSDDSIEYEGHKDLLEWADEHGSEMARSEAECLQQQEEDDRLYEERQKLKLEEDAQKKTAKKKVSKKKTAKKKVSIKTPKKTVKKKAAVKKATAKKRK